jgi:hypothetical protein
MQTQWSSHVIFVAIDGVDVVELWHELLEAVHHASNEVVFGHLPRRVGCLTVF